MTKNAQSNTIECRRFGLLDKVSYAAGDFGCNMSFALAGTYFTLFWTQYMKLDSILFAGLLVVLKIWDAVNDIIIGSVIDSSKKQYRLGKFKHFILIGAIGLTVSACVCFLPVPNANTIVKCILCILGYMAWDAAYTMANVPYGAMLSAITNEPGERAQLGAWRMLGALLATIIISTTLPSLLYDENGDVMGVRLFIAALVLGIVALLAFLFLIRTTQERVSVEGKDSAESEKFNIVTSMKHFFGNRAALGITIQQFAQYLGTYGASTAVIVMFQAYFKDTTLSGMVNLMSILPMLLFIPFVKTIAQKVGKKEASSIGLLVSVAGCVLMCVLPISPDSKGIMLFIGLLVVNGMGMGCVLSLGSAMLADSIDYNFWRHGKGEEGITYSVNSFFRKLAQGIGPSIGLVLMVWLGYDEQLGAAQPFAVALNMRYLVAALYLISAVLSWIGIRFVYNLDKKTMAQMNRELGR